MAALACDLCGGKLVMGAGGIATCEVCGMEYSAERMREKVAELKGGAVPAAAPAAAPAPANNEKLIENYLSMAESSYDAGNKSEAENYANKVIELDPENSGAWLVKGKAAGWSSTLQNNRMSEAVFAFSKAIEFAADEDKDDIKEETKDEVKQLGVALISLRGDRFAKWPDKEEANGFISDITTILTVLTQFIKQAGVIVPLQELMAPIARTINQSVVKAWEDVIWPDYNGDPNDSDDRANKYEWQRFIERVGHCTTLVSQAIDLCDEDDESDIVRYENLIHFHEQAIESCSWDYTFSSYGSGKIWSKDWTLTEEAKNIRRGLIKEYKGKIAAIKSKAEAEKAAAKKARIAAYWEAHKEEKDKLENDKKELTAKKTELSSQIEKLEKEKLAVPSLQQLITIQKSIESLETEKKGLGLFKNKEKKAIDEKVATLTTEKAAAKAKVDAEQKVIADKIAPLNAELDKTDKELKRINTELTKDRK